MYIILHTYCSLSTINVGKITLNRGPKGTFVETQGT